MARTRAYRRAQKERARRRAIYLIDHVWGVFSQSRARLRGPGYDARASRERMIRQFAETRKPCSCWGCGNQRRLYGLTIQEVRAELDKPIWPRHDSFESEDDHGPVSENSSLPERDC